MAGTLQNETQTQTSESFDQFLLAGMTSLGEFDVENIPIAFLSIVRARLRDCGITAPSVEDATITRITEAESEFAKTLEQVRASPVVARLPVNEGPDEILKHA